MRQASVKGVVYIIDLSGLHIHLCVSVYSVCGLECDFFFSDFNAFCVCKTDMCLSICACVSLSVDFCSYVCKALGFCCHYRFSSVGSAPSSPPGQDERSEPQQCGGSLLHPDWRPGPGHAGGAGGVLLQVQDRVAPNEGVHRASCCCLSRSGLSLLSLRQWC